MKSPFPGMDPYLEHPALWPDLHQRLITYLADALQPQVRPRFHARIGERFYVMEPPRGVYPDVTIFERKPEAEARKVASGGRAASAVADPALTIIVSPQQAREPYIEIVDTQSSGRIVTVIEALSPANKIPGPGRDLYLRKQEQILKSGTNLVEIDLLHEGEHTVAVPLLVLCERARQWDYLISISRYYKPEVFEVYALTVRQRLPRIPIPLEPDVEDAVVDLQEVFDRCYENGAYGGILDYTKDPPVALRHEDVRWLKSLLKRKGLRK